MIPKTPGLVFPIYIIIILSRFFFLFARTSARAFILNQILVQTLSIFVSYRKLTSLMATDMTQGEENSNKFLINRGESVETGLPFREMETSLPGTYSNLQVGLGGAAAVGKLVETFSPSISKDITDSLLQDRKKERENL